MDLFCMSWRDILHPKAGGAEVYTHAVLSRLANRGYTITHVGCSVDNAANDEVIDGVRYIRHGSIASVIPYARKLYFNQDTRPDVVVDQCNTHRFFSPLWLPKDQKRVLFIHQLTRELWFEQPVISSAYMNKPLQYIGYMTEPRMLKLYKHVPTMTVCDSTKDELEAYGFSNVTIIPEGKEHPVWPQEQWAEKEKHPTFLYAGRYVRYKQVDHILDAFFTLLQQYPKAKLWLLGNANNDYVNNVLMPMIDTPEKEEAIEWLGFVSEEEKLDYLSRAHALLYASKREGWGIPTIEAASVGTPSIVYNVPGLRDAVRFGEAGILVEENSPQALAKAMLDFCASPKLQKKHQHAAHSFSDTFHWDTSAEHAHNFFTTVVESS